MKKIDLHIHTNLSDGAHTIIEIINKAKEEGCSDIAICDHEIINDYSEYAKKYDINIINGIEFNSEIANLHILGYNIEDIERIRNFILELRKRNNLVVIKIIKNMEKDGLDISLNRVIDYLLRINIDVEILDKRKLVKYLIYKGYAKDTYECYQTLIGKGQKYYIENYKLTPEEIIKETSLCGGQSVMAHPNSLNLERKEFENLLKELINYGLEGIELINNKRYKESDKEYRELKEKYNLIGTYGGDYHDKEPFGVSIKDNEYEEVAKRLIRRK